MKKILPFYFPERCNSSVSEVCHKYYQEKKSCYAGISKVFHVLRRKVTMEILFRFEVRNTLVVNLRSLIPTAWTQGNHIHSCELLVIIFIEALLTRVDAGNLEIVLSWWFSRSLHLILIWRGFCFYSWMVQISLYVVWK